MIAPAAGTPVAPPSADVLRGGCSMRVHHINCISTCPLGGALMDGRSGNPLRRARLTCHCLLVETPDQLILIDTGLGLNDVRAPHRRLSRFFLALLSPDFREEMTAVRQVQALGFNPADVRHIVLSHLDFDHAGGLDDFPGATVHMLAAERDAALAQSSWLDRQRFRPQQWSTRSQWRPTLPAAGEPWFGFQCVRDLAGLPPEVLMIPLVGHTHGHCGVAVDRGDHWLLYAADAYFFRDEMHLERPRCTPGLAAYQRMMDTERKLRIENQHRLRDLKRSHGDAVRLFCAHDPVEFEALAGRSEHAAVG